MVMDRKAMWLELGEQQREGLTGECGETDRLRSLPGLSRRNVTKELRKNSPSSTIVVKSCGARFGGQKKVICPLVTLHYNSGLFF